MNKTSAIFGMLLALVVGFVAGNFVNKPKDGGSDSAPAPIVAAAPDSAVERFKVPVGNAAVAGKASAKVTIIEFSDYQCPFCSRAEATMEQVRKNYGDEVRVAYKHNPLPFHPNAAPAARAAMAAREQGEEKFWQFHSLVFKNQDKLDQDTFLAHARAIGLNEGKFKADLDSNKAKYDAQIEADQREASQFGASGTPAFFINGRFVSGAQPYDNFKKIIDEEIATADKALKAGAARDNLYSTLIQNGKDRAGSPEQRRPSQPAPQDNTVYKIAVGNAATRGPATAKVTIIEFSDFQCPYCSRVEPTLDKIVETSLTNAGRTPGASCCSQAGSTPVIWGDRIFLTSAKEEDLVLLCASGEDTGTNTARGIDPNCPGSDPSEDRYVGGTVIALHAFDGGQVGRLELAKHRLDGVFDVSGVDQRV
mgnify:CR=1 FL=1